MKHTKLVLLLVGAILLPVAIALAQNIKPPNGAHFNLNIIGVEKGKKPKMNNNDRHTIFVGLGRMETATTDIWLMPGDFAVCDGNGFDEAYDCEGTELPNKDGAVFQLPCNLNVEADVTCDMGKAHAFYEVWVRALGGPQGSAWMTLCAYDDVDATTVCNTGDYIVSLSHAGKPTWQDVTQELTVLNDTTGLQQGKIALFAGDYEDWLWQYNNNGLKLASLRFYLVAEY